MGVRIDVAVSVAVAVFLAQLAGSAIERRALNSATEHQTNVQLIELAIGILSKPVDDGEDPYQLKLEDPSERALRSWAVKVINEASSVKFDQEAQTLLISGNVSLPWGTWNDNKLAELLEMYMGPGTTLKETIEGPAE
ncbi:hypothetical protein [Paracoccus sp. PARArs4]|uniref:hypothetical protein n=1 Tax=Paracoccus sp. PARArs4 TaxID=2853442 RepID=UPI0024A68537|nr:hypothetical protein [Paracoccus sp. PARArs4]